MLTLTVSGLLDRLSAIIPRCVIRGVQLGLGIKLLLLALTRYIPSDGAAGVVLAGLCAVVIILLRGNSRCPPALPVVGIGLIYAFCVRSGAGMWQDGFGFALPELARFTTSDMLQGALILALPQIPLSLGNSLFATHQMANDLFPERRVQLRTIGYTYSALNIIAPFVGGIPVCHGSGGMAGHHVFGGRTGGSVLIYGLLLITLGLFFGSGFERVIHLFPLPVLGVILVTEGIMLMRFVRDVVPDRFGLSIAALTASCAVLLPFGFLVGMAAGTMVSYVPKLWGYVQQLLRESDMGERTNA